MGMKVVTYMYSSAKLLYDLMTLFNAELEHAQSHQHMPICRVGVVDKPQACWRENTRFVALVSHFEQFEVRRNQFFTDIYGLVVLTACTDAYNTRSGDFDDRRLLYPVCIPSSCIVHRSVPDKRPLPGKCPCTTFQGTTVAVLYKCVEFWSQVSVHAAQTCELCLSAHGRLPGTLW